VSGVSIVIAGEPQPFGVLGAHTRARRAFTDQDVAFVQTVANVLAAAVERRGAEERLAALALAERLRAGELRAVLEAMDEGVIVLDAEGGVLLRNAAADSLLGAEIRSLDDVLGAFEWDQGDGGDRPLDRALSRALERRLRHADDRWGELRAYPVPDPAMGGPAGTALGTILVVRDVTEERRARTLRDAFIGVLSHELRTPITTIFAGAKILARPAAKTNGEATAPVDRSALVADIEAEADRLYRLVEDLLVLARFERGATEIVGEPVLLQRILPKVVRSEAARWPGTRIDVRLAPDLPAVRADPTYAEQIARNLLANAVKYGDPGSPVTLTAERGEGEVIVRVRDEGPGILPDEVDRLFDLFYRSPTVTRKPGAGIGLFVARRLTETMGGRIWAEPRSPRGSEFGFALAYHVEDEA
jgi:signal transduction histidine kinase